MPKKTKREKILASYRKKFRLLQQQPVVIREKSATVINSQPVAVEPSSEEKQIAGYFFIDLKRSLILIAIVITLEISLYFATIKHYLKF